MDGRAVFQIAAAAAHPTKRIEVQLRHQKQKSAALVAVRVLMGARRQ